MFDDYPYGGFAEYMTAPQSSIVTLPDAMSYADAARWGYFGTAHAGLQRGEMGPGKTLLINGITGTLGLGAALFGLALGARKIFGVGRNRELLARLKAIAPARIEVHSTLDGEDVGGWVRLLTGGVGADVVIDALPTETPHPAFLAALGGLANSGIHVNVGGVTDLVPIHVISQMNDNKDMRGSMWFTTRQGQEMADLVENGMVDLGVLEHEIHPLEEINTVLRSIKARNGGFQQLRYHAVIPGVGYARRSVLVPFSGRLLARSYGSARCQRRGIRGHGSAVAPRSRPATADAQPAWPGTDSAGP